MKGEKNFFIWNQFHLWFFVWKVRNIFSFEISSTVWFLIFIWNPSLHLNSHCSLLLSETWPIFIWKFFQCRLCYGNQKFVVMVSKFYCQGWTHHSLIFFDCYINICMITLVYCWLLCFSWSCLPWDLVFLHLKMMFNMKHSVFVWYLFPCILYENMKGEKYFFIWNQFHLWFLLFIWNPSLHLNSHCSLFAQWKITNL